MADYFRPILQTGAGRPRGAPRLGGGWAWFERVEHLRRDAPPETRPLTALPSDVENLGTSQVVEWPQSNMFFGGVHAVGIDLSTSTLDSAPLESESSPLIGAGDFRRSGAVGES